MPTTVRSSGSIEIFLSPKEMAALTSEREERVWQLLQYRSSTTCVNKKRLEVDGPFAGLWVRTAKVLHALGYQTKAQVRDDLVSGRLSLTTSGLRNYGACFHRETCVWAFRKESGK
jgi:hypothetical protein